MISPCGHFSDATREKARKYSVNPCGMIGIEKVYETIQRFAGLTRYDIANAITETSFTYALDKPPRYSYKHLPISLRDMLMSMIDKHGSIDSFIAKPNAEHIFILGFIKRQFQPADFLFPGVVTPKHQMRGDGEIGGVEVHDYAS